jgi:Xaa-Pro aminopeptidase
VIDYPARLAAARRRMAENQVGLMFLVPGANLFYLTGLARQEPHPTDTNRWGDWAAGAYLGLERGPILVVPKLGAGYFEAEVAGKPWFADLRILSESEDPAEVLRDLLSSFDLRGGRVALDDHAWAQTALAFRRSLPEGEFLLASEIIAPLRMIKEEAELSLMRRAGQITAEAFERALARLRPGVTELEMNGEVDYQLRRLGADYPSFVTDVSFTGLPGGAGSPLQRSRRQLAPGDSVTFDIGCVCQGYCSDFGRSAFAGDPPAEYLHIHETVLNAQRAAMAAMVAGQISGAGVNRIARAIIEEDGYGAFFRHRLGHGIGVTVHEPPWLDVVDETLLQANMTFTVEPSIRIPGHFGNRVEDVVVVGGTGGVPLYDTGRQLYIV